MTPDSPLPDPGSSPGAEELYRRYRERVERGEAIEFEAWLEEHPDLNPALEALHSIALDAEGATTASVGEASLDLGGLVDHVPASLQDLVPGKEIGPYRLLEQLGEGGFGLVFLAEQQRPVRRRLALKIIKAGMDTREVLARFEAERQALAYMDHPNISRVYDFGTTDRGRPYFVMEYVDGEPLTRHCDRQELDLAARLELFGQVCDAIHHAHQRAIIHRDIKPSNILVARVDGQPTPKVIDFGIAKATEEELTDATLFTRAGQIIGTPAYMSPEQASGDPGGIDVRTDVYSLGVLLHELLVGALPLEKDALAAARDIPSIQSLIRDYEPRRPSQRARRGDDTVREAARRRGESWSGLARALQGDLDWIVLRALEKDPSRRYGSVAELSEDLRRHREHLPVLAGPPSKIYVLRKFMRKRRVPLMVLGAMAGLLVATALMDLWGSVAEGHRLVKSAEVSHIDYLGQRDRLTEIRREYEMSVRDLDAWLPPWRQREARELRDRLREGKVVMAAHYSRAMRGLEQCQKIAPTWSGAHRRAVALQAEILRGERELAIRGDGWEYPPVFYEDRIVDLGVTDYDEEFRGSGDVGFTTDSAGAEVHCFRYVESEAHLLPLAFDPRRWSEKGETRPDDGIVGVPFLRVSRVLHPVGSIFEPGDELVKVGDVEVRVRGDLARALEGVGANEARVVAFRRGEETVTRPWVPFPDPPPEELERWLELENCPYGPGELLNIAHQLGLHFEGYPLRFSPESTVGVTGAGEEVRVRLPRGSYLFVLRKTGHLPVRFPVVVPPPSQGLEQSWPVELIPATDRPPGCELVAAGPVALGGDGEAFQSKAWSHEVLPSFFIAKFETTMEEYLEFLNDPEMNAATDQQGTIEPRALINQMLARENSADESLRRIQIVPLRRGSRNPRPFLTREGPTGPWRLPRVPKPWGPRWPVTAINRLAVHEYLAWRNRTEPAGWSYRLPSDAEWEKAARGVDRRLYVWGNHLAWTHSWNPGRFFFDPGPGDVGSCPLDESVYGIRDLAGSVSELTIGHPDERDPSMLSYRGGNWNTGQASYYRLATRNGLTAVGNHVFMGFRLVVERK